MNTKQLQYVIQLSKVRNFSQAAQRLNMSQPALSKQILSLEKELGVKLFDRDSSPLTLTPAGEEFVQEAQELIYKEEQLSRTMERYRTGQAGRLVIGISPFRSLYLLPEVLKKVKEQFPGVQIDLQEYASNILRKEAAEGKYDFAVINLPVNDSVLDATPIEQDTLVLAVPKQLLHLLPSVPEGELPPIDLADCKALPFIVINPAQEMRRLFNRLCARAEIHPRIAMEVVGVTTAWAMMRAGIGATLLPLQFVKNEIFDVDVALFTIKDNIYKRQPVVVTRRGQKLSDCARYAIDLLTGKTE